MKAKKRYALIFTLVLLVGAAVAAVAWAAPGNAHMAGGAPTVVAYQGEVHVSGAPYDGNGHFKFAVVNAAGTTSYWSNDGSSTGGGEPTAAVELAVSEGLFSVLLGDTTLTGMTQALVADVFNQPGRYLRVWFSASVGGPFSQLTPDTRIAAVPYALQAQEAANAGTVDGYEGAALEESAEIDAKIAAHTANSDAHHTRYTDGEAWAAVLGNDGAGSGLDADTLDGLHASQLETHYQNVVVVAKSGGDYTSVQAAIDSITDASASNPYLVWVAPGVYQEQVTMKSHVHLQGAGQEATIITSAASSSAWPPAQASLFLASDTSLRDLTVGNSGAGEYNAALLATAGVTRTLVADVTARAQGGGLRNYAIMLSGSGTGVRLQHVTALAENGGERNFGLVNFGGTAVVLRGGTFTGRGGDYSIGILNFVSGTTLEADNVTALGENGSVSNTGLHNSNGAGAKLHGGFFTGRGGVNPFGIGNNDTGTTLEAEGVTALAENGSGECYGLGNYISATATLRGGSFTGWGGTIAYGITNGASGTNLVAESISAQGENASDANHGLFNFDGAAATLSGGAFTGRGGTNAHGITNTDLNSTLVAQSVTALAENGSTHNFGLNNIGYTEAWLGGGAFIGRGGTEARGIHNHYGAELFAANVTTLGENGSSWSIGLVNFGAAVLRGGSFTGRAGTNARGIYNSGSGVTLTAERVTALGSDGSSTNYGMHNSTSATATANSSQFIGSSNGLYQESGTVYLGVSQLDGGATRTSGTLTCFQVYDGSYAGYTCP